MKMSREELKANKARFEKEGYVHNNVVKELFEIAEKYIVLGMTQTRNVEVINYELDEPGC